MIAQQEAMLQEENKMRESEKKKFLNIVSKQEHQMLAQDKADAQKNESEKKDTIKPVVFNNIDASTGKPTPLKDTTSLTPMELQKKLESNQKKLNVQDKKITGSIENLNHAISDADKLINSL